MLIAKILDNSINTKKVKRDRKYQQSHDYTDCKLTLNFEKRTQVVITWNYLSVPFRKRRHSKQQCWAVTCAAYWRLSGFEVVGTLHDASTWWNCGVSALTLTVRLQGGVLAPNADRFGRTGRPNGDTHTQNIIISNTKSHIHFFTWAGTAWRERGQVHAGLLTTTQS